MAKEKTEVAKEEAPKNPGFLLTDELIDIAKGIRAIAVHIPTPGVLDSDLHGHQLKELAARLEKLAETL